MFGTLKSLVQRDHDYPERTYLLDVWRRVLDGTIYEVLAYEFHEESTEGGEYIPLQKRRPSVRCNLARIVVRDAVSLLFGEGRFPVIASEDEATRESLAALVKATKLNQVMVEAAQRGSVGSVAVRFRALKGRAFYDVMETLYLTPEYDPEAPDTLVKVTEARKVSWDQLKAAGYDLPTDKKGTTYWFRRVWDTQAETWYVPQEQVDYQAGKPPVVDTARTVRHQLGFVPLVWIKNLPGGTDIDGACTFAPGINTITEIDYQLSQAGRGLRYASDPKLVIKGALEAPQVAGGSSTALTVDGEHGDAKLLEINGTAAKSVVEYVESLRAMALEAMRGNRSSADKLSAAQSGRALELLHQALIWLADDMRVSYGEGALLDLVQMAVKAHAKYPLSVKGVELKFQDQAISLQWPAWFPATYEDKSAQASAISTLRAAGAMSRKLAVETLAPNYDVEDPPAEIAEILADIAFDDAREMEKAAQEADKANVAQ
jgi:hypothetical protein